MRLGGELTKLWGAWRYGGEDPYRLYNLLDENYVPHGDDWSPEEAEPKRPPYPSRLRAVIYAFQEFAHEQEMRLAGVDVDKLKKQQQRKLKARTEQRRAEAAAERGAR